ncbi:MAG TPA: hypothetical protein VH475_29730 [Tepidisphaeraceae bacterium]
MIDQFVDQDIGRFELEMNIDDSQMRVLLSRQSKGVNRCRGRPDHLHPLGLKQQLHRVGNVPMILHDKDTHTPEVCMRLPFTPPIA